MKSHEVLKRVLAKTSAKRVAAEMNLSLSLIYKWAEPPSNGTSDPLERVAQLLRLTGDLSMIEWLAESVGLEFVKNGRQCTIFTKEELAKDIAALERLLKVRGQYFSPDVPASTATETEKHHG